MERHSTLLMLLVVLLTPSSSQPSQSALLWAGIRGAGDQWKRGGWEGLGDSVRECGECTMCVFEREGMV